MFGEIKAYLVRQHLLMRVRSIWMDSTIGWHMPMNWTVFRELFAMMTGRDDRRNYLFSTRMTSIRFRSCPIISETLSSYIDFPVEVSKE